MVKNRYKIGLKLNEQVLFFFAGWGGGGQCFDGKLILKWIDYKNLNWRSAGFN
jgi:hypothetical protein